MEHYFVLEGDNNDNYPIFSFDSREAKRHFLLRVPINIAELIHLKIGDPKPRKPQFVDYHETPMPVFSEKIKNVLEPMSIGNVQLVKAELAFRGCTYGYWILHVIQMIPCIDLELSKYERSSPEYISDILKLVLNESKLSDIPLKDRLIIKIEDFPSAYLFEESIKNAIMSVNPVGLRFFHTDEWNSLACFH